MSVTGHPSVDEVREQLLAAVGTFDRYDLWSQPGVPRRLSSAAERMKDAVIDFRSALELQRELSNELVERPGGGDAESVVTPFGLLTPEVSETELPLPHTAQWVAWREVAAAAEAAAMASFVAPWPGQPKGWIDAADGMLDAINALYLQEGRALRFAEDGHRPYLLGGPVPDGVDPDPTVPPSPGRRVREFQAEFAVEFAAGLRPLFEDDARTPPTVAELVATFEQQRFPVAPTAPSPTPLAPIPSTPRPRAPSRG